MRPILEILSVVCISSLISLSLLAQNSFNGVGPGSSEWIFKIHLKNNSNPKAFAESAFGLHKFLNLQIHQLDSNTLLLKIQLTQTVEIKFKKLISNPNFSLNLKNQKLMANLKNLFFPGILSMGQNDFEIEAFEENLPLGLDSDLILQIKNSKNERYVPERVVAAPDWNSFQNFGKNLALIYDDPLLPFQWGLQNLGNNVAGFPALAGVDIQAGNVFEKYHGSAEVKIALIDSGIDYHHPDLRQNIWLNQAEAQGVVGIDDDQNGYVDDLHGYNFSSDQADPMDDQTHGTHCAGTIAAFQNNALGIFGMMNKVSLMALKFIAANGFGDTWKAVLAIDYAIKNKADLIAGSWGSFTSSELLKDAFMRAQKAGILVVVAAGNAGLNLNQRKHYPSSYLLANIVSVAAHDAAGNLAAFSNFGAPYVQIAAPGVQIISSVPKGEFKYFSGTSMAAPFVAGALGLLIAKNKEQGRRLSFQDLKKRLLESVQIAPAFSQAVESKGRLDLNKLLAD